MDLVQLDSCFQIEQDTYTVRKEITAQAAKKMRLVSILCDKYDFSFKVASKTIPLSTLM